MDYISGFIKQASLFYLDVPGGLDKRKPYFDGSTINITVPQNIKNTYFGRRLAVPFKINKNTFVRYKPVTAQEIKATGILTDAQLYRRIRARQTGGESNAWVRANGRIKGSSSAFGPVQLGKRLLDPIPVSSQSQVLRLAFAAHTLRAQRDAFLHFGRQPKKPGYDKAFQYSSRKDKGKGVGPQYMHRHRDLQIALMKSYISRLNRQGHDAYVAQFSRSKDKAKAQTAYYNALAALWYGDYRDGKNKARQKDMLSYAQQLRTPNAAKLKRVDAAIASQGKAKKPANRTYTTTVGGNK